MATKKKISIIIPRHHEPSERIDLSRKTASCYDLLSSIDTQIGVNWDEVEVLIVNDDESNVITDFSRFEHIKDIVRNLFQLQYRKNPGLI